MVNGSCYLAGVIELSWVALLCIRQ